MKRISNLATKHYVLKTDEAAQKFLDDCKTLGINTSFLTVSKGYPKGRCCRTCKHLEDFYRSFIYDFHSYDCDISVIKDLDIDNVCTCCCDKWENKE